MAFYHLTGATAGPANPISPPLLTTPRSLVRRGPRTPRKISAHATKLEAVDDSVDPLGPLGDKSFSEEAPVPPQKEPLSGRLPRPTSSASQSSSTTGMMDSVNLGDDQPRVIRGPPPVQPPANVESSKRQTQPSISVERAAKPTFQITVGDPHKVGDLTSSHIVYQVRTKVELADRSQSRYDS
jgi:sorting nexin-1/2